MFRRRLFKFMLVALTCAAASLPPAPLDATVDGKPYAVSLNKPVTFPIDI